MIPSKKTYLAAKLMTGGQTTTVSFGSVGGESPRPVPLRERHPNRKNVSMKKLRLILAIALVSLGVNACTGSPLALDDCDPDVEDCEIKPVTGN